MGVPDRGIDASGALHDLMGVQNLLRVHFSPNVEVFDNHRCGGRAMLGA